MATEKLRAELELITSKAEKDLARFHRSLKSVDKTVTSIGGKGGKSMRPLGEGLSAATANASEFEKSMAAANARVIAFGASAGLIMQVQRALKETVKSTIEVEKALADINVVLNTNSAGLQKFGDQLFKIASQTGQGFKTVAVAATELARQGLSMEKTLLRTKDALILTRLTGMGAEEAVSTLTAAVNSFNKVGITSAQVVNKMAKVDQAFAVSSDDLAKAISRVGSSAVDAGVSMDELLAITTAVQQRTARGGAVIGNAFKTIFTRIGRTDVQKKLAAIGVATKDMQGQMLPATKVLENLSQRFQGLAQSQQNQIAESVAGVFQVNILRAALGDLASKYGVYNRAIKESSSATDEAYKKNEQLNQTLDALANKTLANLTKAGAGIGGATLKPAIENVLNLVNSAIGAFSEGGRFEEFGKGIGKDLLTGLGNFISGPGLAIITIGIGKLAINFASFAKTAIAGVLELNKNALARKGIEDSVTAALMKQPGIIKQIERGELSAATAARDMLASMRAQNMEASKLAVTSRVIAGNMMGMGARGGRGGGKPGRASGLVPNFASPSAERASAAAGGYRAGAIKTMNVPGEGSVMYNGAETVKRFPGMVQPAIMPPKKSPAGANYKSSFGAAHGFDPYAASGFVPNFNEDLGSLESNKGKTSGLTLAQAVAKRNSFGRPTFNQAALSSGYGAANVKRFRGGGQTAQVGKDFTYNASHLGLLGLEGAHSGTSTTSLGQLAQFKEAAASGLMDKRLLNRKVTFTNMQKQSISSIKKGVTKQGFSSEISRRMIEPVADLSSMIFKKALGNNFATTKDELAKNFGNKTQLLPPGAEGSIFEAAINLGILTNKRSRKARLATFDQGREASQKPFDFEETGKAKPSFIDAFGFGKNLMFADAKRTIDNNSMRTLIKKAYNKGIPGLPGLDLLTRGATIAKGSKKTRASGHVPNFSPLGDAITRERAAGVPVSAIRVSSSPALKGSGNPGGLGVHNTIDEPAGLGQGISRSRRMGINPKTHGAARGLVPNFDIYGSGSKYGSVRGSAAAAVEARTQLLRNIPLDMSKMKISNPTKDARDRLVGKDGPRKIDSGGEKIAKAANKFEKATDAMTGRGAMMGAGMSAMMMAPMMMGGDVSAESQGRMGSLMGFGFGAQALSSMIPQAAGGWGAAAKGGAFGARGGFGFRGSTPIKQINHVPLSSQGFPLNRTDKPVARFAPAKMSFMERAKRGLGSGLKQAGRGLVGANKTGKIGLARGARAALGKAAVPLAVTAGVYDFITGALTGWKNTLEEDALEESKKRLQDFQQADIRPVAENLMGATASFAGGHQFSSGKVRRQQFGDIRNLVFGEGGIMSQATGDNRDKTTDAYEEFTSSFGGTSEEIKTAAEKFNEALLSIVTTIQGAGKELQEDVKIKELNVKMSEGGFEKKVLGVRYQTVPSAGYDLEMGGGSTTTKKRTDMGHTPKQVKDAIAVIKGFTEGGIGGLNKRMINDVEGRFDPDAKQANELVMPDTINTSYADMHGEKFGRPPITLTPKTSSIDDYVKRAVSLEIGNLLNISPEAAKAIGKMPEELTNIAIEAIRKEQSMSPENIRQSVRPVKGMEETLLGPSGFDERVRSNTLKTTIAGIESDFVTSRASKTLGQETDTLQRDFNNALEESSRGIYGAADVKMRESMQKAKDAFDLQATEIEKDIDVIKKLRESNVEATMAKARKKTQFLSEETRDAVMQKIEAARNIPLEGFGSTDIHGRSMLDVAKAELDTMKETGRDIAGKELNDIRRASVPLEIEIINEKIKERDGLKKQDALTTVNNDTQKTRNRNSKISNDIEKERIKNAYKLKELEIKQIRNLEEGLKIAQAKMAGRDFAAGKIGGRDFASAQQAARAQERLNKGAGAVPFAGFGTVAKEAWAYNALDATNEFEAGMADVAVTVRDSLKDAIKNIASGADSFKDAMFNVFAALADKLADQGINMGVNSMFNWLGNLGGSKHGGSIPRGYNKGGVVTGGSGVRDDVMTRMQGGEYVIKKSAAQKIGYETLSSINSYAGGGQARVSLAKEFLYTGDDPKRPTGGKYNVSRNLSTAALFREDDPQTGEMFGRQETLTNYLEYRRKEQERRDKILDNIKRQKRQRLMNAYMSAAMRIGVAAIPAPVNGTGGLTGAGEVGTAGAGGGFGGGGGLGMGGSGAGPTMTAARGGSPALVMGGEYVMSPRTVSKYGTGFMSQLNQGRLPSFQSGGPVGGGAAMAAGITTNNVSLSVNIDKSGGATAETGKGSRDRTKNDERGDAEEAQSSKEFAEAIRGAVLKEITKQQRPGGLLRDGATWAAGRRT